MRTSTVLMAVWLALGYAGPSVARAEAPEPDKTLQAGLAGRDSLTGKWFGHGDRLAEQGLQLRLSGTQVYQSIVHRTVTHWHAGRYSGSYDLEVEGDLERMAGLEGGSFSILAEGSWSEGLDASSVSSVFGVNDQAGGDQSIDVTEFWYQQAFCIQVTPWLHVSPHVQYVADPGGLGDVADTVVLGVRVQASL